MKMIEWPKPPSPAVPFQKSSDPAHVRFVILNSTKTFYVGDQLQVMLQMIDFEGRPKQYGGDYLQGRIHTPDLKAGSAGTGKVEVSVSLVHPSEEIQWSPFIFKKPILPSGSGYITVKPSSHIELHFSIKLNDVTSSVLGLRKFDLGNSRKTGPHLALDLDKKIKVEYYAHGKPIRILPISSQDLPFIANKLDEIKGGKSTIIAFTIWCHFNTFPIEPYIRRLQNIRRSILRLLDRSPDTLVVIKTANVQALPRDVSLYNSDWYSYQLDLVMTKMFEDINVAFVDAWEMTIAHYLPHELHPQKVIVKNEVDVFLSCVCPLEKN
ncbi:NXPE family member 3-like [Cetorhinus maximus]